MPQYKQKCCCPGRKEIEPRNQFRHHRRQECPMPPQELAENRSSCDIRRRIERRGPAGSKEWQSHKLNCIGRQRDQPCQSALAFGNHFGNVEFQHFSVFRAYTFFSHTFNYGFQVRTCKLLAVWNSGGAMQCISTSCGFPRQTHRRVRLIHTSALLLSMMAALLQVCNAQDVTPEDSSEPPIEGAAPVELLPISPEKNSVHDKGFDLE